MVQKPFFVALVAAAVKLVVPDEVASDPCFLAVTRLFDGWKTFGLVKCSFRVLLNEEFRIRKDIK